MWGKADEEVGISKSENYENSPKISEAMSEKLRTFVGNFLRKCPKIYETKSENFRENVRKLAFGAVFALLDGGNFFCVNNDFLINLRTG